MDANTSTSSTPSNLNAKKDPGWKYVRMLNPPNVNDLVCNFCGKITKGGIFRAKQHIVGGHRNAKICQRCPAHVREEIQDYMTKKAASTIEKCVIPDFEDAAFGDDEELDDISGGSKNSKEWSTKSVNILKRPRQKGPIDVFFCS